jgi:hypothetical protein
MGEDKVAAEGEGAENYHEDEEYGYAWDVTHLCEAGLGVELVMREVFSDGSLGAVALLDRLMRALRQYQLLMQCGEIGYFADLLDTHLSNGDFELIVFSDSKDDKEKIEKQALKSKVE